MKFLITPEHCVEHPKDGDVLLMLPTGDHVANEAFLNWQAYSQEAEGSRFLRSGAFDHSTRRAYFAKGTRPTTSRSKSNLDELKLFINKLYRYYI